jgi:hypothetical protein
MRYAAYRFECLRLPPPSDLRPPCGVVKVWAWDHEPPPPCPTCGGALAWAAPEAKGDPAAVIGDDIPGGVLMRHAVCWPDGTPRRFYSKRAIVEAAREAGWTREGETPLPPRDERRRERYDRGER